MKTLMKELVLYIHGKGGCAGESEHYKPLFPACEDVGLDYQTFTPWETGKEIRESVTKLNAEYDSITLIAKLCFPCDHTIITVPESPMFNASEAAVVTVHRLTLVKQAGRQYAEKGEIEASLLAEITSPMIPEDQYAAIVNSGV